MKKYIKNLFITLNRIWHRPATFYRRPWIVISLNVLVTAWILLAYQPLGYRWGGLSKIGEPLGILAITYAFSWFFLYFVPFRLRSCKREEDLSLGYLLIYMLLFIGLTGISIFLFDFHVLCNQSVAAYGSGLFFDLMKSDLFGTFAIGIFPLYIGRLLDNNYQLKQDLYQINLVNRTSHSNESPVACRETLVEFNGETKESLIVNPEQIVYIESAGNYVDIYYEEVVLLRKTIRIPLKRVEEQLSVYHFFIRCHRTYLVNLNYVVSFCRNEQGYRLKIRKSEVTIPVSRTYLDSVKEALSV